LQFLLSHSFVNGFKGSPIGSIVGEERNGGFMYWEWIREMETKKQKKPPEPTMK
jgi:hypothetical protein